MHQSSHETPMESRCTKRRTTHSVEIAVMIAHSMMNATYNGADLCRVRHEIHGGTHDDEADNRELDKVLSIRREGNTVGR